MQISWFSQPNFLNIAAAEKMKAVQEQQEAFPKKMQAKMILPYLSVMEVWMQNRWQPSEHIKEPLPRRAKEHR
jgi:hypothetical protein